MDTELATARRAVEFIWEAQDGFFELARDPATRAHYTKSEALNSLAGNRYYAPLARKTHGSTKKDVADAGNVLWADIDSLDGLERLERLPIAPSLVVFSGMKGFWVYLKLSEPISSDEIELLNRGLEVSLDADHCHNKDRIARLPGSIHQGSGELAKVVEFSGLAYSRAEVAFLEDLAPSAAHPPLEPVGDAPALLTGFPNQFAELSDQLWLYIERSPRRGEDDYDRSVMEQKIFTALAYQGWTDAEIISFATAYRLPRHVQEWAKHKNYSWTERSIRKAREWVAEHPGTNRESSTTNGMCIGSDSKAGYFHTDRYKALRLVRGYQTTKELIQEFMTKLPNHPSESTAYRMLKQFKKHGLISKKASLWELTDLGRHHTATKMNYLMVLPKIRDEQPS